MRCAAVGCASARSRWPSSRVASRTATLPDSNLQRLEEFARQATPLLAEVTLVGGCTAGLLITDPGAASVRPTVDVDIVIEAATYAAYDVFCRRLAALQFAVCTDEGAPICRWVRGPLMVDVLTTDGNALGFGNRWFPSAIRCRSQHLLPSGHRLHHIDASHFVASKLEAFRGRGEGDYVTSHDLEDVIRVIDGRSEISNEFVRAPTELSEFVAAELQRCLEDRYFVEALPGYFPGAQEGAIRSRLVQRRIRLMLE